MKFIRIISISIIFLFSFFLYAGDEIKLSLPIRLFLQDKQKVLHQNLLVLDREGRVEVLIEADNPYELRKLIREKGGMAGTVAGRIITARLPVEIIPEIAEKSGIISIRPSRRLRPLLDISRLKISADKAENGDGLQRAVNGTDVIIGVVDTGIDYRHPDFKNPDGSTRIIALWDQTINGTPPPDFGYGAECDVDSINNNTCREMDTDPDYSHGTHVAGIAGGSHYLYRGIAPSAMFVIVKTSYTEGTVIDGVDYVFRLAEKYRKPAVVNLSLGGSYGPHDGTGDLVRALESLQGPGKVIVSAGGNSGDMLIHAGGNTGSETWFVMDFDPDSLAGGLDVWYDGTDSLDFAISAFKNTTPLQLCKSTSFVPPGQSLQFTLDCGALNCGTVYIDTTETSYPGNGDRNVLILIQSPSQNQDLARCRWGLGVKPDNSDPGGGNFDAWIITDNGEFTSSPEILPFGSSLFSIPGDSEKTISVPADGKNIIAVGSYTSKTRWRAKDGKDYTCEPDCVIDNISYFSSNGPTRDGRTKPDITAPGEWIASSKSSSTVQIDSRLLLSDNLHFMLAGTSMASPHTTGAVALMLDLNPELTPQEVKNYLINNTDIDSFTGSVPNNTWGYGKLNVQKVLQNLPVAQRDTTPPFIYDTVIEMNPGSIKISWNTDELANGGVKVRFEDNTERELSTMSYSTSHNFVIDGIESGRIFRIQIFSADPRGNTAGVTNIPGVLPEEGCGCNYTEKQNSSGEFLLLVVVISVVLFLRYRPGRKEVSLHIRNRK